MAKRALVIALTLLLVAACGSDAPGPRGDGGAADSGIAADGAAHDSHVVLPALGYWTWRRVCHQGRAVNEVTVSAQATPVCGDALVAPYLRVRFDDTQPLSTVEQLGRERRMSVGGATLLAELCRADGQCDSAISGWVAAAAGSSTELRAVEITLDFAGVSVRLRSPMFEICVPTESPGC